MASTTFYGSDTSCVSDVGLVDVQITNPRILIGQRIARLLQTPRGALASVNDDPGRGYDLRALINGKIGPSQIATAQAQIEAEVLKDEEVESCSATLTFSAGALSVALSVVAGDGPFALAVNVSSLTTDLIFSFADGAQ